MSPDTILGWVRDKALGFAPDSSYTYSNTDNSILALIAEAVR